MLRHAVVVLAGLLLIALGASLGSAEERSHVEDVSELLALSGIADRGRAEVERRLEGAAYPALKERFPGQLARATEGVKAEMTVEAYAEFLAPTLDGALSDEDTQALLEIYRRPVMQKWLRVQEETKSERESALKEWSNRAVKRFFRLLAPNR